MDTAQLLDGDMGETDFLPLQLLMPQDSQEVRSSQLSMLTQLTLSLLSLLMHTNLKVK
jgi:hypothetical protein